MRAEKESDIRHGENWKRKDDYAQGIISVRGIKLLKWKGGFERNGTKKSGAHPKRTSQTFFWQGFMRSSKKSVRNVSGP